MKTTIVFFISVLISSLSYSQQTCDCETALAQLIEKIEAEYPGFEDKTKDSLAYTQFRKKLTVLSANTPDNNCIDLMTSYTDFFKDRHLVIYKKNGTDPSDTQINTIETFDIGLKKFKKYLTKSKDSIEGIWNSDTYEVGVVKQDSNYIAFIISSKNESWKPSQIKFKLNRNGSATYYMGDHSQESDTYSVIKRSIIYFNDIQAVFVKSTPAPTLANNEIESILEELEGFYLKPVSPKTMLFKIPSFASSHFDKTQKLIAEYKLVAGDYENLILDLRGNGGGSDHNFHTLLPVIYTNPERYLSGEYFVTQTLIDGLTNWTINADKELYADDIEAIKNTLKRMEGKHGSFIPIGEGNPFGFVTRDTVYQNPKHIAILVDKWCGSSTEHFLLSAKQSKKVKILGEPTAGVLDYTAIRDFNFVCDEYTLLMPTIRVMRIPEYPIDNIGIQPDIFMDKYVEDWVQFAIKYLENEL